MRFVRPPLRNLPRLAAPAEQDLTKPLMSVANSERAAGSGARRWLSQGKRSAISWADSTFNRRSGCARVGPARDNCHTTRQ